MTKKNRRVGVGMKPRVSAATARGGSQNGDDSEVREPVQTGGEIAQDSEQTAEIPVQNLDSGKEPEKAASVPAEEPKGLIFGMTGFKALPDVKFNETGFVDPPQMRVDHAGATPLNLEEMLKKSKVDPEPFTDEKLQKLRTEMAKDGATPGAIESALKVGVLDRAGLDSIALIGENPDGTFGLVVTIPEGYIEPIRGQAESDGVSPEDWVSTRLNEYLESWWSAPKGR
jgi:hypothetical protein